MNFREALEFYSSPEPEKHAGNESRRIRNKSPRREHRPLPPIPDYMGFESWASAILGELTPEDIAAHHIADIQKLGALQDFLSGLLDHAEAAGILVSKEGISFGSNFGSTPANDPPVKRLNKAKLILNLLKNLGSPRMLDVLSTFREIRTKKPGDPPRNASAAMLRAAFFSAQEEGNSLLAYKTIGRLREEDHDPGELDFFEANAAFSANRFSEAIEWAEKVPPGQIDWHGAFKLKLESLAWLGKVDSIIKELHHEQVVRLALPFRLYLGQIATLNSGTPEQDFPKLMTELIEEGEKISQDLPFFRVWNRFSCLLAVRYVADDLRRKEAKSAERQTRLQDADQDATTDSTQIDPDNYDSLSARELCCLYSLLWDNRMVSELRESNDGEESQVIIRRLFEGEHEISDHLQALEAQLEIGSPEDFVNNVVLNFEELRSRCGESVALISRFWKLVCLAYREAVICRLQDKAGFLESVLSTSPFHSKVEEMNQKSVSGRIERKLSPMGRLAYRSACLDLSRLNEPGSEWQDAGMVSLGFFRIVELEYNSRIILPALKEMDLRSVSELLDSLPEDTKNAEKRKDSWCRVLKPLEGAKNRNKTLELGTISMLLEKACGPISEGPDGEIRRILQRAISSTLNERYREVFLSGELVRPISDDARERFRNPPAHTRYLPPTTANDCKKHVDQALTLLFECTDT